VVGQGSFEPNDERWTPRGEIGGQPPECVVSACRRADTPGGFSRRLGKDQRQRPIFQKIGRPIRCAGDDRRPRTTKNGASPIPLCQWFCFSHGLLVMILPVPERERRIRLWPDPLKRHRCGLDCVVRTGSRRPGWCWPWMFLADPKNGEGRWARGPSTQGRDQRIVQDFLADVQAKRDKIFCTFEGCTVWAWAGAPRSRAGRGEILRICPLSDNPPPQHRVLPPSRRNEI